eukprot:GHVN01041335.1.p1 GENE.GHVN01041335.1~~GHVN01041335.1.p1  ORF type:complete len:101 (+),score=0.54 GHVN01041335.1:279-581(+)
MPLIESMNFELICFQISQHCKPFRQPVYKNVERWGSPANHVRATNAPMRWDRLDWHHSFSFSSLCWVSRTVLRIAERPCQFDGERGLLVRFGEAKPHRAS